MTPSIPKNISPGRALVAADIIHREVWPLAAADAGCLCYLCVQEDPWNQSALEPLTPATGVFTSKVRCNQNAPVWVCLEHLPHTHNQFEAFAPAIAQALALQQHLRDY